MGCNSFNFNGCTSVKVGYDYAKKITYTDSDDNAIDLTGYDFSMSIQAKNTNVDLLTLSVVGDDSSTGIYISDAEAGEFYIQIRKADSTSVGSGSYDYAIRITNPSGDEDLFMYGGINFDEVG